MFHLSILCSLFNNFVAYVVVVAIDCLGQKERGWPLIVIVFTIPCNSFIFMFMFVPMWNMKESNISYDVYG
jgi:hypothetical protein